MATINAKSIWWGQHKKTKQVQKNILFHKCKVTWNLHWCINIKNVEKWAVCPARKANARYLGLTPYLALGWIGSDYNRRTRPQHTPRRLVETRNLYNLFFVLGHRRIQTVSLLTNNNAQVRIVSCEHLDLGWSLPFSYDHGISRFSWSPGTISVKGWHPIWLPATANFDNLCLLRIVCQQRVDPSMV